MTRPNEMLAARSEAGLKSVEQSSITIRFEYENFSDYWLPIAAGEAALGKFALSLAPEQRAPLGAAGLKTLGEAARPTTVAPDPSGGKGDGRAGRQSLGGPRVRRLNPR